MKGMTERKIKLTLENYATQHGMEKNPISREFYNLLRKLSNNEKSELYYLQ